MNENIKSGTQQTLKKAKIHTAIVRIPNLVTQSPEIQYPDTWQLISIEEYYSKSIGPCLRCHFIEVE